MCLLPQAPRTLPLHCPAEAPGPQGGSKGGSRDIRSRGGAASHLQILAADDCHSLLATCPGCD